jgi:hypothetical protein
MAKKRPISGAFRAIPPGAHESIIRSQQSLIVRGSVASGRGLLGTAARWQPSRLVRSASSARSLSGRSLGHYCVESLLGAGGMGEVYLASRSAPGATRRVEDPAARSHRPDLSWARYCGNDRSTVIVDHGSSQSLGRRRRRGFREAGPPRRRGVASLGQTLYAGRADRSHAPAHRADQ